jgi:hypothetical protein
LLSDSFSTMRVAPVLINLTICASVGAFAPSQSSLRQSRISIPLSAGDDISEASDKPVAVPVKRNGSSESIPFVKCPAVLLDCDLAGNVGFDPLGLSKNKEQLLEYREAEIKHARLAMLVRRGMLGFCMPPSDENGLKGDSPLTFACFFLLSIVIAYRQLLGGLCPNYSIGRLLNSLGSRRSLTRQIGFLLF